MKKIDIKIDFKAMIEIASKQIADHLIKEVSKDRTDKLTTDDIINISNTYTNRMMVAVMQTYHNYLIEQISKKL